MQKLSDLLFLIAGLLVLLGLSLRAVEPADAQSFGLEVTGGGHAWVNIRETIPFNNTVTVYTVPSDRVFVLQGANMLVSLDIKEDGVMRVPGYSGAASGGPLSHGHGQVVFPAGSNVQVFNSHGSLDRPIYLQGYLAHP